MGEGGWDQNLGMDLQQGPKPNQNKNQTGATRLCRKHRDILRPAGGTHPACQEREAEIGPEARRVFANPPSAAGRGTHGG